MHECIRSCRCDEHTIFHEWIEQDVNFQHQQTSSKTKAFYFYSVWYVEDVIMILHFTFYIGDWLGPMPSCPIVHVCMNYTSLNVVRPWSKSKPLQATWPSPHFCPLFSLYMLGTMEERWPCHHHPHDPCCPFIYGGTKYNTMC